MRPQTDRRTVLARGVLGVAWIHGEPGSEERKNRLAEPRDAKWDLYFAASVEYQSNI